MPSSAVAVTRRPVADLADRLVVVARARDPRGAEHRREQRLGEDVDAVFPPAARLTGAAVAFDAGKVGDVLVQRAAERDVQHLQPATDRERRGRPFDRGAGQRELGFVGGAVDAVHLGVPFLAVAGGIDVGAAAQHERVDAVEQRHEVARGVDHDGLAARAHDRVEVRTRDRGRARVRPLLRCRPTGGP